VVERCHGSGGPNQSALDVDKNSRSIQPGGGCTSSSNADSSGAPYSGPVPPYRVIGLGRCEDAVDEGAQRARRGVTRRIPIKMWISFTPVRNVHHDVAKSLAEISGRPFAKGRPSSHEVANDDRKLGRKKLVVEVCGSKTSAARGRR
jgi:hypothetical protein